MVYKKNFVVVVKCDNKILRERTDNNVVIPFGSEYSLLLKNLDSRRAVVKISIDDEDVLNGSDIVIDGNKEIELEGFLDEHKVSHKFRFIQKTGEIIEHRGDKIDDGIIRIEYQFEENLNGLFGIGSSNHHYHYYSWPYYVGRSSSYPIPNHNVVTYGSNSNDTTFGNSQCFTANCNLNSLDSQLTNCSVGSSITRSVDSDPHVDEGLTVKGSESDQRFSNTWVGELSDAEVITLKLKGTTSKGKVAYKPITVRTKIQCDTCGRKWKSNMKYCGNCSTALS